MLNKRKFARTASILFAAAGVFFLVSGPAEGILVQNNQTVSPSVAATVLPAVNTATATIPIRDLAPVAAKDIDKLDPQPEPPAPPERNRGNGAGQATNAADLTKLDPQPEPPAPANVADEQKLIKPLKGNNSDEASVGDGKSNFGNINSTLQAAQNAVKLNPQPEPPLPEAAQTQVMELKRGNNAAQPMKFQYNPLGDTTSTIDIGISDLVPSQNSIEARFKHGEREINVPIRADVKIENSKMVLSENGRTAELKLPPALFYKQLEAALDKKLAARGVLKNMELSLQDGEPVYTAIISEPVKLLWFIPLNVQTRAVIDARTNKVREVKQPWFGFLVSKSQIADIEMEINLKIESMTFEPAAINAGEKVKVKFKVVNDGLAYALDIPDFLHGGGPSASVQVKGSEYKWIYVILALAPGESAEFDLDVSGVCGADTTVELKTELEEATKDDNKLTAVMKCN